MSKSLTSSKYSVSIPSDLDSFVEAYRKEHGMSRSEVIAKGLKKLKEDALAQAYKDHAKDPKEQADAAFWDEAAVDDGIGLEEVDW